MITAQDLVTKLLRCPRDPKTYELDIPSMLSAAPAVDMIIVTSPNNPTGNVIAPDDVARLCEACPGIVMIDEAYAEFADEGVSCEQLLATYGNLVVLHTFSKAYCLAGVRVGYVLAAADVIDVLGAVRQPYTADVFAQAAAEVVCDLRQSFDPIIAKIREERDRLAAELAAIDGVSVWPSQGNFLLARMPRAGVVRTRLRDERSILVRDFSAAPGLEDCLRITVGTPEENTQLIDAIASIVREES